MYEQLYPSEMHRGRGLRQFLLKDHYRIHRSLDNVTLSNQCYLVERHFGEGNNFTITLRPNPEQQTLFQRQGPRPRLPWSYEERGNPGCLTVSTRCNRNKQKENLSYLDVFARGLLLGRSYVLSQNGDAEESLVVPTTPSQFQLLLHHTVRWLENVEESDWVLLLKVIIMDLVVLKQYKYGYTFFRGCNWG